MSGGTIELGDGGLTGYLACPAQAPAPAILLIQEIFGVNATMRGIADGFAAQGFLTLAPDLFWRQQPGVQLLEHSEADRERATALMKNLDERTALDDLASALEALSSQAKCSGAVAVLGYCLGGRLAALLSARLGIPGVAYYPVGLGGRGTELAETKAPLLVHLGEEDPLLPPEPRQTLHQAVEANPRVTVHDYPAAGHAFARPGGATFAPAAAALADRRTLAFLSAELAHATEARRDG